MEQEDIIRVQDLTVSFQSGGRMVSAVHNVSFAVREGSTLAIVGESGSGKSVSSLSLMGLLPRDKTRFNGGRIQLNTRLGNHGAATDKSTFLDVSPGSNVLENLRGKGIAMIFQEPMTSLNPVITCGEQVAEMLRTHHTISREIEREKVIALFREVMLPRPDEMFDQYPHQLSGGQRQRVMIAMAISCQPDILIADEPTTALDVTVQKEILLLLKSICRNRKMAMIFITHDLGVVEEIADDILVMRKGEVVEYGVATEVLSAPKHAYTKGLLACRPRPEKKHLRLLTVADIVEEEEQGGDYIPKIQDLSLNSGQTTFLLQVSGLTKTYITHRGIFKKNIQRVKAVDDVSFEIRRGETLGLVGESGCGKTTLSRMLLALIQPTSGKILFTLDPERPSISLSEIDSATLRSMRKEIQIIFQDPYSSLNPRQSVLSALTEPLKVYGLFDNEQKRKQRATELLHKVGLSEEHLFRYPHEFSGGQRQRIVIARALACEPSFIICDESVSALDVSVQAQVLNLLNDLKKDLGLTYLFISHDLNVVYYMSDRIMVMNKGRIEEIDTSDNVFYRPKSEYTKRLLGSVPGLNSL